MGGAAGPDPGTPAPAKRQPSSRSNAARCTFNSLVVVIGLVVALLGLGLAAMTALSPRHKPLAWVAGLLLSLFAAIVAPVLYVVVNTIWGRFDRRLRPGGP